MFYCCYDIFFSNVLFGEDKQVVIIGVIGKSHDDNCNKMAGFDMIRFISGPTENIDDGQIKFYFDECNDKILYMHFETTFDNKIMEKLLFEQIANECTTETKDSKRKFDGASFNSFVRTRFAQILMFAIHVCHVIVVVEPSNVFDSSYLNIFKALKVIREKYVLKFLPKFLKNSNNGALLGKEGRLCSPRFIFFFEEYLDEYNDLKSLQKLEFEIEDSIYKMLRNEFIITNSSSNSLFSIPRNKRFVCINTNQNLRPNLLSDAVNDLAAFIKLKEKLGIGCNSDEGSDSDEDIRPFKGFAKPLDKYDKFKCNGHEIEFENRANRLISLIHEHVDEALRIGFDDSIAKFKGKSHFVVRLLWFTLKLYK